MRHRMRGSPSLSLSEYSSALRLIACLRHIGASQWRSLATLSIYPGALHASSFDDPYLVSNRLFDDRHSQRSNTDNPACRHARCPGEQCRDRCTTGFVLTASAATAAAAAELRSDLSRSLYTLLICRHQSRRLCREVQRLLGTAVHRVTCLEHVTDQRAARMKCGTLAIRSAARHPGNLPTIRSVLRSNADTHTLGRGRRSARTLVSADQPGPLPPSARSRRTHHRE